MMCTQHELFVKDEHSTRREMAPLSASDPQLCPSRNFRQNLAKSCSQRCRKLQTNAGPRMAHAPNREYVS